MERRTRTVLVAIVYLAGTVLLFAPAFDPDPATIPSRVDDQGKNDGLTFTSFVQHYARAFTGESPFIPFDRVCHPDGMYPGEVNPAPALLVPAGLITAVTPLAAGTVFWSILFASFALTALAAGLYIRRYTDSDLSAFLAAPLFVLVVMQVNSALIGHINLIAMFWLPLIFLSVDRFLDDPGPRTAAVMGILNIFQFYTNPQMTAFLAVILPVYAGTRLGIDRWRDEPVPVNRYLTWGGAAVGLFLIVVLPYYWTFRVEHASVPLSQLIERTADAPFQSFRLAALQIWLSAALLVGFLAYRLVPLMVAGVTALVLAVGPLIQPSPYLLLYHAIPVFEAFKSPHYFQYFYWLFLAAMAGYAIDRARELWREPDADILTALVVVALIAVSILFAVPDVLEFRDDRMGTYTVERSPVYDRIANSTVPGTVAHYPNVYLPVYDTARDRYDRTTINCQASHSPESLDEFRSACGRAFYTPDETCRDLTAAYNVSFIVFHRDKHTYKILKNHLDFEASCRDRYADQASLIGEGDLARCCTGSDPEACILDSAVAEYREIPYLEQVAEEGGRYLFRVNRSAMSGR